MHVYYLVQVGFVFFCYQLSLPIRVLFLQCTRQHDKMYHPKCRNFFAVVCHHYHGSSGQGWCKSQRSSNRDGQTEN